MIRYPAARRAAAILLHNSIVRMPVTEENLDMGARIIMLAVSLDEQRQRSEELLAEKPGTE